ncbi:DUF4345 domain-containing protein [Luteipulveratus sp. YIM 133132]|uniref:DUF4345 domain-containing protein n=1 Tax=Luteipulveratus flavus TaxID=3031728 RepID=UPI0023AFE965|nr:DUF4345 domain-containing protein [Luteipulveratus sp. YIM 133132]MDE9364393.1 DUF4345 domain-containing protein [Luteipulveratus sp. YIM 133132]
MSPLTALGRFTGGTCAAIGGLQLLGGTAVEPGMSADPTVDSYVRFMGTVFAGYGLGWLEAARAPEPDLTRMRVLAGLMAVGGLGRVMARAKVGPPHRFHDVLLAIELAAPVLVEVAARADRRR